MNVALIGSVSSSLACLEALHENGVDIVGVLGVDESQAPDISDYRSLRDAARRAHVPFQSFVRVSEPEVASFLRSHPHDLLWVIGLSQMMPSALIEIASVGGIGFHPTMLPEGRGRAPVAWTVLLGAQAAVSLFFLTDEPDAGDLIAQEAVPVLPDDYSEDLIARTNVTLKQVVARLAPGIVAGSVPRVPQNHDRATHYERRTAEDGLIHWSQSTDQIYSLIRAGGRPYPGAFSWLGREKVTIWRAAPADGAMHDAAAPGTVLAIDPKEGWVVRTGDGALRVTESGVDDSPLDLSRLVLGSVLGTRGEA